MAEDLADGEFWLPSQFLTEEDILMGFDTSSSTGFNSDMGSPAAQTESDDDEFLAGLTRQMARSSLLPNSPSNSEVQLKSWVLSGSPQSILCAVGGEGSPSRGSSTSPPAVSSVAGELAKKGTGYFDSNRVKQSTAPVSPLSAYSPNFHAFQSSRDKSQFQQSWSREAMKQGRKGFHCQSVGPLTSKWQGVQRQPPPAPAQNLSGSGMRAFFLGSPAAAKRESVGTGVFFPRSANLTEPRKKTNNKPACATVLVPEKVVQALKNINAQSQSQQPRPDSSGRYGGGSNGFHAVNSLEMQLPPDWTY